jgi:hypothetical protein
MTKETLFLIIGGCFMARPTDDICKKRGENVKKLFKWWKETHPKEKKTQAELAYDYLHTVPSALSGKMKGEERYLNEEDARMIASYFPGARVEFVLGYDDFITESDKFDATISEIQDESHLLLIGLNAFAKLCDYQIKLTSPAHKPEETSAPVGNWMKMIHDGYTIRKDDQTVQLSLEEMNAFENEVCDFVELKLKHLFKQKGDRNNG